MNTSNTNVSKSIFGKGMKLQRDHKSSTFSEDLLRPLNTQALDQMIQYFQAGAVNDSEIINTETMTRDLLSSLSLRLSSQRKNSRSFRYYEATRILIERALESLFRFAEVSQQLADCNERLEATAERAHILDDLDALREYLDDLRRQTSPLEEQTLSVIPAMLKPEYAEYVRLYGFPDGGAFNEALLSDITRRQRIEQNEDRIAAEESVSESV